MDVRSSILSIGLSEWLGLLEEQWIACSLLLLPHKGSVKKLSALRLEKH